MNEKQFLKISSCFTGLVAIAEWSLLAWDHYHAGVPSHHLLNRKDLPAISNWWGGLLVPLLTLFLLYRIQKRLMKNNDARPAINKLPVNILYCFTGALIFGILLSVFFTLGYTDIPGYMLMAVFVLALFFPVYRAEFLLGFVIGMTFTFGGVLPTIIGSVLLLITAIIYLLIRPLMIFIASKFMRIIPAAKNKNAD